MPSGNLANAASLGANTVKGPSLFSVSTRPAAFTAATRVVNSPAATAVSTISCFSPWCPAKAELKIPSVIHADRNNVLMVFICVSVYLIDD